MIKYKIAAFVCMLASVLTLSSCYTRHGQNVTINRTVIMYLSADNNLDDFARNNLVQIKQNIGNPDKYGARLVAYVDRYNQKPFLAEIRQDRIDTLKCYPEEFSSDAATFGNVLDEVRERWPSDKYGLVMWSHGTGWVPTDLLHTVAYNLSYVKGTDGTVKERPVWEPSAETKAFGYEQDKNAKIGYRCMDIEDMAAVIPDGMFEFIAFDACYMGCVEIAYALRKKTRQIVSSAYEIVGDGFPYASVIQFLLKGDMKTVCEDFYNYYNSLSDWKQMGGISLVRTEGLDSLALCFSKCIAGHEDDIRSFNMLDVQRFDRFARHVMFDMKDFVDKICTDDQLRAEFDSQVEYCIPYSKSTPYMFKGDYFKLKIDSYCGLSMYIPFGYNDGVINDAYRTLSWSRDTGY